jgi:hypothetical protein
MAALWLKDGVEAGYEHVGWYAREQRLVDLLEYLPGEEESRTRANALSMLEVASAIKAAGVPLPVASPTTTPNRPSSSSKKS